MSARSGGVTAVGSHEVPLVRLPAEVTSLAALVVRSQGRRLEGGVTT